MTRNFHQGKFRPKYPEKYMGDPTNIVYRSSWELKAMNAFDLNPGILYWSSEECIVPYYWELDGKMHRYFPDFIIIANSKNGPGKAMIEIKPYKETIPPVMKKGKRKKTMVEEVKTWSKNQAKWAAAAEYCSKRDMDFIKMTEYDLFPNGKAW